MIILPNCFLVSILMLRSQLSDDLLLLCRRFVFSLWPLFKMFPLFLIVYSFTLMSLDVDFFLSCIILESTHSLFPQLFPLSNLFVSFRMLIRSFVDFLKIYSPFSILSSLSYIYLFVAVLHSKKFLQLYFQAPYLPLISCV